MSGPVRVNAARRVRELIGRVAGELLHELPSRPVGPGSCEPLAGVRAARLVGDVATAAQRSAALDARAAGWSWDDVAAALELEVTSEPGDGPRRDELAYEYLIEHRALSPEPTRLCQRPAAWWRCSACGARVRDTGPFESHPDDREQGHTEACPRRSAELSAWRRGLHDDTELDRPGNGEGER